MAFAPLITRIYGPEAFGLFGAFSAFVAVATPMAALAYPVAIVLPWEDSRALALVRLSLYLSISLALLTAALLWIGGDWLISAIGAEAVTGYLLLIPLAMLFSAWMQIAQQWLIRKKEFGVVARSAVTHAFVLNCAKTGIGWFHPLAVVLIVLATVGHAFHAMLLFLGARSNYNPTVDGDSDTSALCLSKVAHHHRDFPLYRAPQNFINAASQSLPIVLLAAFFGPASAGFYTAAKTIMGMPSAIVGKAVNDVFYPRITEAAHRGEPVASLILKATGWLFGLGVVPFGLVVLIGPRLFGFVFGSDWVVAGEYARWLALFFFFNFINKPSVAAVPVLEIQRGLLYYELISTGTKLFGLAIGFYWFKSDIWAVVLFSLIGVAAYGFMMAWIFSHALRRVLNEKASR